jgi:hypothetical protein
LADRYTHRCQYEAVSRHLRASEAVAAATGEALGQREPLVGAAGFDQRKIVYPVIGKEPRFTFDAEGFYVNDKAFILPADDLYVLGVLNSGPAWGYLKAKCSVLGDEEKGGRLELRSIYMAQVPVPHAPEAKRRAVAALVRKCLDAKGVGCEEWEREIDDRVAALYGL